MAIREERMLLLSSDGKGDKKCAKTTDASDKTVTQEKRNSQRTAAKTASSKSQEGGSEDVVVYATPFWFKQTKQWTTIDEESDA